MRCLGAFGVADVSIWRKTVRLDPQLSLSLAESIPGRGLVVPSLCAPEEVFRRRHEEKLVIR